MADRSVVIIVPAAQRDNANAVFAAWGRGPNTLSTPASPTGSNPPTHYLTNDNSMTPTTASEVGTFPDDAGTVPDISPNEWGEGRLSRASARVACAAMQVAVATNIEGENHVDGVLEGLNLERIQFIP